MMMMGSGILFEEILMMMEGGMLFFGGIGTGLTKLIIIWRTIKQSIPDSLTEKIEVWKQKFKSYFFPVMYITFDQFSTTSLHNRNEAFTAIENYLSSKSSTASVTSLKAESFKKKEAIVFTAADYEEIEDTFQGVKVKWYRGKHSPQSKMIYTHMDPHEKHYFTLCFNPKHRDIITEKYMDYVLKEGKAIRKKRRHPRIFSNDSDGCWKYKFLEHPASFHSFAMDDDKKKDLIDDLLAFSTGKEKYAKIGKAWKRGYLLYGPPGTGKSTLILAMANLLRYDIYDLELTTVTDNTQLKTLLINLSRKGIVVVEDIDCSLDITGKRTNKDDEIDDEDEDEDGEKIRKRRSKVTLSGFLNFVDGIWSACGGEKIFVFTTNHIDKLDPALIRKGRMDKHIELSYCTYQGFKVLAKNYLDIDSHSLFKKIEDLLGKVNMTPAEVSEHLIHITLQEKGMLPAEGSDERIKVLQEKAKPPLERLIQALETAKEEAREEEATAAKREEKKKRIVDNFSSVFKSKKKV